MILNIKELNVSYWSQRGYARALKDINFTVNRGEVLGIVGESGSGKSTLAYSILNLLPQDAKKSGDIYFKEQEIFNAKENILENIRGNKIGMIFQAPASTFNPVLTVGYQFNEVLKYKLKIKSKTERERIIFDSLKQVKLPDVQRIIESYPHQLSGGQLQRVAIAIAISHKPDILIADEPTSSLDVTIESQIIYLFKELQEALNLTIVFITHNLDLVKILSDRVVVVYQGKIREITQKDELFNEPKDDYTKKLLEAFKNIEG